MSLQSIFGEEDVSLYKIQTHSKGADGSLPLTPEMLLDSPSGDLLDYPKMLVWAGHLQIYWENKF